MTATTLPIPRRTVVPHAGLLADAAIVLGGALFVALTAQIEFTLGFTPVPISGQTFGVVLTAAAVGAVRGTLSMALYWVLGLGLPFYSGGDSGWENGTGATFGYFVGFVVAGALVGWLAEQRWDREFRSSISAMFLGNVVIFAAGLVGLSWWLSRNSYEAASGEQITGTFEQTLELGLYPFIVGDVIKLLLAAACLPAVWKLVERVRPRGDER